MTFIFDLRCLFDIDQNLVLKKPFQCHNKSTRLLFLDSENKSTVNEFPMVCAHEREKERERLKTNAFTELPADFHIFVALI